MTKIYNAPKPKYSNWEWFQFIAFRIVFPPLLLWDLLKFGMNKWLGQWVSRLILPAQEANFSDLAITDASVSAHNEDNLICEKHEVVTYDGAHLDTFEVGHATQANSAPQYQKYIINLVGNGMCYEQIIDEMKTDAKELKTNVIGFNLRGVGNSSGKPHSKNDLVTDGIAQVQRLLDQGVSPQNITLKGHSLGAGIASLIARHFHELKQPINLFNGRSFSTLTSFVVGHIRLKRNQHGSALGHKDSIGGIILGWLAMPFIKLAVALVKWEINAGSAFSSIPKAYREYIVVRSREEVRKRRIDDPVIPHYASIHTELAEERRKEKAAIDDEIVNLNLMIKDSNPLARVELVKAKSALIQARERIKHDRKMETDFPLMDGHNSDLTSLHNRSGKSAQTFFREFVQRVEEDHAVRNRAVIN